MNILFPFIETFSPIIPLIACIVLKPRARWITILVVYFFVYMLLAGFANFYKGFARDNILIYVAITVFTFCCFALLINQFIVNKRIWYTSYLLMIAVLLFAFYNSTVSGGLKYYDSRTSSLSALLLISYCIYYYCMQIMHPKDYFIYQEPSFWIITGIFIYCGGNFFLFTNYRDLCLQAEYLLKEGNKTASDTLWRFAESIWIIADLLILLTNILFAKAILCTRNK